MSIINQIVTNAIEAGSSDIHLEEDEPTRDKINPRIFEFEDYKLNSE